ncbi:hypothetical protein STSO111631_16350 [Stackebrandtia soli]
MQYHFLSCRAVGRVDDGVNIANQEHLAVIALCEAPGESWDTLWEKLSRYY